MPSIYINYYKLIIIKLNVLILFIIFYKTILNNNENNYRSIELE